jgi:hypothetical protein
LFLYFFNYVYTFDYIWIYYTGNFSLFKIIYGLESLSAGIIIEFIYFFKVNPPWFMISLVGISDEISCYSLVSDNLSFDLVMF